MKKLKKYWIYTLVGMIVASFYPIYMGASVVFHMITKGTVPGESFPKYIIPYTPISIALIIAVLLMPFLFQYVKKFVLSVISGISLVVFFVTEFLLESKVIVTTSMATTLESWQMYMCYVPPGHFETREWKAVDILMGEYSPTFKLHFYLISVVLIIAILNCLYGFAQMIFSGNHSRKKALVVQSVCTVLFLGLCIFACFTAFFRDGELTVSPLSAILMGLFFVVMGVTAGAYAGSFLIGKRKTVSVLIPSVIASFVTLLMYIGEMFLLSFHLYRFGSGFLFEGLPGIVLAPVDILIILLSGGITAFICCLLNKKSKEEM